MSAYELTKTILKDNSGLVSYYRFESGALTTDEKAANTLTNNGTITAGTGVYGGSANFGAGNSTKYFSFASTPHTGTGNFSWSVWFKTSVTSTRQLIISYGTQAASQGLLLGISATRKLFFDLWSVAGPSSSANVDDGNWHHAAVTYNGTTVRLFLDGGQVGSQSMSPNITSASARYIGASIETGSPPIYPFQGELDDIAQFNIALSADQVKELYEGRYIGEWLPQSNLVGLWHLNGNSTDSSGNNNHGTDTAITYSQANGKFAQGAGFNGTTSVISCGTSSAYNLTSDFTIMCWIKPSTTGEGGAGRIVSRQNAGVFTQGYRFNLQGTNVLAVTGDTTTVVSDDNAITMSSWQFVAVTRSGSGITLYKNGASIKTGTISTITSVSDTLYIGNQSDGARTFDGNIDEVAIFSRALTAAEIRKWYAWSVGRYL